MKFDKLILRKIFKFVAVRWSRCQILRLKCTIFNFGWDSARDPARGACRAPPGLLAGFKGSTSEGAKGVEMGGWEGKGEGKEWEATEEEGPQRVGSHPHVRSQKYPDCRTDLIGVGGNTDVCPGRQTPSRRHCVCDFDTYGGYFTRSSATAKIARVVPHKPYIAKKLHLWSTFLLAV